MRNARSSTIRRLTPIALLASMVIALGQGTALAVGITTGDITDKVISDDEGTKGTEIVSEPILAEEDATSSSASAEGTVAHVAVGGTEVVTASRSKGESTDKGCKADATVLSILGQEIIGAHAECKPGEKTQQEVGYLQETCDISGGAVCLVILYGNASTSDDEKATSTSSDTAVARACVGGEGESANEPCSGPVGVGVAESRAETRAGKKGDADARQSSTGLRLCIGGTNPDTGKCDGIGVVLLHEEGAASAGSTPSNEGESYLVGVEAQGEDQAKVGQSADILPGCSEQENPMLCVALNKGTADASAAKSGNTQQAIGLSAADVIAAGLAQGSVSSEGQAVKSEREAREPNLAPRPPAPALEKEPVAAGPRLPLTGSAISPVGLIALTLIVLGAALWRRGREDVWLQPTI